MCEMFKRRGGLFLLAWGDKGNENGLKGTLSELNTSYFPVKRCFKSMMLCLYSAGLYLSQWSILVNIQFYVIPFGKSIITPSKPS